MVIKRILFCDKVHPLWMGFSFHDPDKPESDLPPPLRYQ